MKTRLRRKKSLAAAKPVDAETAYDGDFETTDSSQVDSSSAMSCDSVDSWDLSSSDLNPSVVLTPIKTNKFYNSSSTSSHKKSRHFSFSNSELDSKDSPKSKNTKKIKKKSNKSKEKENAKKFDSSGFALPGMFEFTPVSEIGKKRKRNYSKVKDIFAKEDSGIVDSSPPKKATKFAAKDTSTPSVFKKSTPYLSSSTNDSCLFGFESMESRLTDISPVKVMSSTPMSDYHSGSSLSQMTIDGFYDGKSSSQFSVFSDDDDLAVNKSVHNKTYGDKKDRKKKVHKHKRYSNSKIDAWASQMKDEFEDIENFELSIEG